MIKIDQNYTDYRDDSDPKYPGGKAVNATTSEGVDGTPLLADWMNDINGALQAIFIEAFDDINKVSGKPDDVQESDILKAIKKITQDYTDWKVQNEALARAQGDTNALKSAKDYTDQNVRNEARAREQGNVDTLKAAKDYTDRRVQSEAVTRAQGDTNALKSAKDYTDSLLIKIFQNGYVQWPGMPTPDKLFGFSGYRWAEVNYNGAFFRAKGTDAEPFGGKEQGDAIRNITGNISFDAGNIINKYVGAFKVTERGVARSWRSEGAWRLQDLNFDASRVVPTANENRPRNKTFIIWRLVKI